MASTSAGNFASERFPYKLWKLVNDSKEDALVWDQTGKSILINSKKIQKLLNKHVMGKSTVYNSFVRQLNLYGFKHVIHLDDDKGKSRKTVLLKEYCNEYFQRGHKNLLVKINRNGKVPKVCLLIVCFYL